MNIIREMIDAPKPGAHWPDGTSPMLASVGLLGVAGVAGGSLLAFKPGDRVTYVDEQGVPHAALVKVWWGSDEHSACNLAYVDESERDGPVLRNVGSVSRGPGSAPGRYWQPDGESVTMASEAAAT